MSTRGGVTYVDATDNTFRREKPRQLREMRFGEATFDPAKLPEQLTSMQTALSDATNAARTNRRNQARVYENVNCGTAGAELRLEHRLGRFAQWSVISWRRATPGGWHGLEESAVTGATSDENTLILVSYVQGVATIEVF